MRLSLEEKELVRRIIRENSLWVPYCGCLLWQGGTGAGYPQWKKDIGGTRLLHRLSYAAFKEDFDNFNEDGHKIYVCHSCDTPLCLNHLHLFLGTNTENLKDMNLKGRHGRGMLGKGDRVAGEKHGMAKLTEKSIRQIHNLHAEGILAKDIGPLIDYTNINHIRRILRGGSWKEIFRDYRR
jgi:hypothetical protein